MLAILRHVVSVPLTGNDVALPNLCRCLLLKRCCSAPTMHRSPHLVCLVTSASVVSQALAVRASSKYCLHLALRSLSSLSVRLLSLHPSLLVLKCGSVAVLLTHLMHSPPTVGLSFVLAVAV